MRVTRVAAHNWRNFKNLDVDVGSRLMIVGPNAAGKSNLLDLFRFLGDLSRRGGGLASALEKRGGLTKTRCLFARNNHKGELAVEVDLVDGEDSWRYELAVKGEKGGHNRPVVVREIVTCNDRILLSRPDDQDRQDRELLTQTHLEQISANQDFRPIAKYFANVNYFHLVPQVIRYGHQGEGLGAREFGSSMIAEMNKTRQRTRDARFRRITKALEAAVPGFEELHLEPDAEGWPHLVAMYRNWRKNPSEQNEVDFSDGTLRLIGLLWTIISAPDNGGGVLLLEEPELSLNAAIVRKLASTLAAAQRGASLQVILSTHAPELLDDEGVNADEVLVLRVTKDGTEAELLSRIDEVQSEIDAEIPFSEIVSTLISPGDLTGLISAARG